MTRLETARLLRGAHQQLRRDGTVDLELGSIDELLDDSTPEGSGASRLVGILDSALRLPATLVIRLGVSGGGGLSERDVVPFRDHCRVQANDAWREAMTLRQGGLRELPRALVFSLIAAALGVVSGYVAQGTDSALLMILLYAVAFIAVIAAWTIGWTPIEQALFDWRAPGHTAAAYELMSQARVEVTVTDGAKGPTRPSA